MLDNIPDTLTLAELQSVLQIGKILHYVLYIMILLQDIGLLESGYS